MFEKIKTKRPQESLTDEEISIAINLYLNGELNAESSVVYEWVDRPDKNTMELHCLGNLDLRTLKQSTLLFYASENALKQIRSILNNK